MGVNVSHIHGDDTKAQKTKSNEIDSKIREERKLNASVIKLLLLGAAEGGKSTVLKQLRILHQDKFKENELNCQKNIIHCNILQMAANIFELMSTYGIKLENPDRELDKKLVQEAVKRTQFECMFNDEIVFSLLRLKNDPVFHGCYTNCNQYQLLESTKYFFDNLERICSKTYVPIEQDILRARVATTGINEIRLQISGVTFRIVDVGGQRSERRKWIHCFSDVDSIIFIASLSEYNQTLAEDSKTNRMHESITLFGKICNCRWFVNLPMILFLNKKDIFAEKLLTYPINVVFPEYKGPQTYESTTLYIEEQFQKEKDNPSKTVYVHKTCATDSQNIQFVFDACMHIIIGGNLKSTGLS